MDDADSMKTLLRIVERIDDKTDDHTAHLQNIRSDMRTLQAAANEQIKQLTTNAERIADSMDRIANKAIDAAIAKPQNLFDWKLGLVALVGIIAMSSIFILAFTGTSLKAVHGPDSVEVGQ